LTNPKYDKMLNRPFTPFPVLATERLTLRHLAIDDDQEIFALRSDIEINKYLGRQASKTIEDARDFINKINDNIKKNDSIYWAITLTGNRKLVGTICLFDLSDENNRCEIGYELLTNFQGQAIMKEAIEKVIEYGFQTMQLQTIDAYTHKDNQSSTKLLEKVKFKKSTEPDKSNPNYYVFTLTASN
jgi:[ribosomal protein S5]-alanine N-acetyltransferase